MKAQPANNDIGSATGAEVDLDKDTIHHLLSNERRRLIVDIVERQGPISKGELASIVAARENHCTIDQLETQERKRVKISHHQVHLPKLEDHGVICTHENMVGLGPHSRAFLRYLRFDQYGSLLDRLKGFF